MKAFDAIREDAFIRVIEPKANSVAVVVHAEDIAVE